jgi:intergrase/recombinase
MVSKSGLEEMINWIKQIIIEIPRFRNAILFNTLTGLRPDEALRAFSLLSSGANNSDYINREKMILEHFRYPEEFLRKTKKAFVSVVNEEILGLSKSGASSNLSYNAIRKVFQRKGKQLNLLYCRKVFATFLRQEGIESEIIDLLQGRIPNSMFVMHYYRPDLSDIYERVREKITKLHEVLIN